MGHPFEHAMQHAITIAEKGRWKTAPNPVVGAVLVHNKKIVAEGFHAHFGSPHAETSCLYDAQHKHINTSECTLVVTLEPCNHYGKTIPCTQTILDHNIKHVVIGTYDPNPFAAGGTQKLKSAGVTVETGILENACKNLIADFFIWQTTLRPYVLLKLATTLDGRIATRTGNSKWISSETSRKNVHMLRANIGTANGAILIGRNTLHMDNPKLTSRIEHADQQPLAIILTSTIPTHKDFYLFSDRPTETIIYTTTTSASTIQAKALCKKGITIYPIENWEQGNSANLLYMLEHLRSTKGCPYVLCEGGGKLGLSLLKSNLVDEMHLYITPKVLGDNNAIPAFDGYNPVTINDAICMELHSMELCDTDIHLIFKPEVLNVYRHY